MTLVITLNQSKLIANKVRIWFILITNVSKKILAKKINFGMLVK